MTDPKDRFKIDAFNRPLTLNLRNVADIAAHYPYSAERFRIFVDGTRQFIQYNGTPTQYEDIVDAHLLKPQTDGEVVHLDTTEIFRYVVGYVIDASVAWRTNQALQGDDVVVVGYGEPDLTNGTGSNLGPAADGWFFRWTSDLDDFQVRLEQYRNGTLKDDRIADTNTKITDWTRRAMEINWYNVGATNFAETYSANGTQFNDYLGAVSVDNDKGPETGNQHVTAAVKAGSAGAGSLELEVGSIGVRLFGDTTPIVRRKTNQQSGLTVSTTGTFVPIHALTIDSDRAVVSVELTDLRVTEFSGNGDVVVAAFAFDQSKLEDSGGNTIVDGDFSTPNLLSDTNSVVKTTAAVNEFPDSSGTITTSADDPGGYQEGFAANYSSGGSSKNQPVSQQQRRLIAERDVIVFLANATATGDVTLEYNTEEQW